MTDKQKKTTFRLGIILAGAVSAGAYSAGALYYLLDTLEKWQAAKDRNTEILKNYPDDLHKAVESGYDPSIPEHDVIIEILGGASAGSIVAAIAALGFGREMPPVQRDQKCINNLLYDSWVNMMDNLEEENDTSTLQSMFVPEENELGKAFSLLNAEVLTKLGQSQLEKREQLSKAAVWPPYIAPKLQLILTLTSLRGVDVGIYFSQDRSEAAGNGELPAHFMRLHRGIAHFQLDKPPRDQTRLTLDLEEEYHAQQLVEVALASGAFPVGFPPRDVKIDTNYILNYIKRFFHPLSDDQIKKYIKPDALFNFPAVDGGTLNNEPFAEVDQFLNECKQPGDYSAMIMIDPFPNFGEEGSSYHFPRKPTEILTAIINAIRGEAMIKNPRVLEGFTQNPLVGMIFPSRRVKGKRVANALATAGLGGFGGFISRTFRQHDFELGMKNCQSFIRKYLYIDANEKHSYASYRDWVKGNEKYDRFCEEVNGGDRFPIIPDMAIPKDRKNRKIETYTLPEQPFPTIDPDHLKALLGAVRRRIRYLLFRWLFSITSAGELEGDEKLTTSKDQVATNAGSEAEASAKKQNGDDASVPLAKRWTKAYTFSSNAWFYLLSIFIVAAMGILYYFVPHQVFWCVLLTIFLAIVFGGIYLIHKAASSMLVYVLRELHARGQLENKSKAI